MIVFHLPEGRFSLSTQTSVVYGVCIDPFSADRVASFQEVRVYVKYMICFLQNDGVVVSCYPII